MIPSNKKIAVLHPYLNKKGGAVNMMIYLSDLLSKNKNDVTIYTFSYDNTMFLLSNKVTSFENTKLVSFIKIAYNIRNCDYIFIGNSPMQFVGVFSKIFFGSKAKILWWHHHYPWYYIGNTNVFIKLKKIIEKFFIKSIDSVIVNSKFLQNSVKEIYNIDSKILYPVLDNKFLNYSSENKNKTSPSIPLLKGEESSSKVIFSYGRWVFGKNLELVFQTYEILKNKCRELVLIIGGEGDDLNFYKYKYKDNKNIIFLGLINKDQIIQNLEKSNLFLFPSKIDSFGLVILESMSIGVPVVSFNIAGAKEIIINGINGYLVNSDSEFMDKSYEILINSAQTNTFSTESIKTARTFSEDTFKKSLSEIFNSIKI